MKAASTGRVFSRPSTRLLPGEGEELVRRALEDLILAHDRDPDHAAGLSRADLARDLGVSEQRARDLLDPDKPQVNLRAGQLLALRPRVRSAVLGALQAESERLEASAPRARRPLDSRIRQLGGKLGRINELLDRALEDGQIDQGERAGLRAALSALASEASAGAHEGEP